MTALQARARLQAMCEKGCIETAYAAFLDPEVALIDDVSIILTALEAKSATPIDMLLYCPMCGIQHIDEVESVLAWTGGSSREPSHDEITWDNPPHRSHLCHACGCIWRPADVATNGVAKIATESKADTWGESNHAASWEAKSAVDREPWYQQTPSIGAATEEPSIEQIVTRYYRAHFSQAEADAFTARYLAALTSPSALPETDLLEDANSWYSEAQLEEIEARKYAEKRLKDYARHDRGCLSRKGAHYGPESCDCGLNEVLAAIATAIRASSPSDKGGET